MKDFPVYQIINLGDAPAKNIKIKIYFSLDKETNIQGDYRLFNDWDELEASDEKDFPLSYQLQYDLQSIDPLEHFNFDFGKIYVAKMQKQIEAKLKIFYGQPKPKTINFNIYLGENTNYE